MNKPPRSTRPDPLEEILRRYLMSGDEEALEEVVEATRPRLLGAARKIGAPQDAEDAVQSAYLSLVRKRGAPLDAPVLPWLLTAVIRIAYRRKALQQRETPIAQRLAIPATGLTPIVEVATKEEESRVRREVLRLPPKYRDPVVLHYLQGLTQAETAILLEVPEPTVRTRLHRARKLLRGRLSPQFTHALLVLPWAAGDLMDSAWTAAPAATGTTLALVGALLGFGASGGQVTLAVESDTYREHFEPDVKGSGPLGANRRHSAEFTTAREQLVLLREETRVIRAEASRLDAAAAEAELRAGVAGKATADHNERQRARYRTGPFVEVLDRTNWDEIGRTLHELIPMVGRLNDLLAGGAKVTDPDVAETIGRQQVLNAPLIVVAIRLYQSKNGEDLPSEKWTEESPNAGFTHPAFMANAMAATLQYAELPLDEAQDEGLGHLAEKYSALEAQRLERYGEITWRMQRLVDEVDLRQRFYDEVHALLTTEQVDVLSPAAVRGTLKDIFSAGLLFNIGIVDTFEPHTRDRVIAGHLEWLGNVLKLSRSEAESLREVVAEWVDALPASRMSTEATVLEEHEVVSTAGAREAALHAMDLLRAAVRVRGREGDLERARNVVSIPYPIGKVER